MMKNKTIQVADLTRMFGDFTAVDHISFEVGTGEIFGFLGANGAGKTTAIRMLIGLLSPTSGKARGAGYNVYTQAESIKKRIGYMSQKVSLYEDLRAWENMRLYGGVYGGLGKEIEEEGGERLGPVGLESVRDPLIGSPPLGWKQKLAFSVAVMHDPDIVFLDEPTGGVDPITRRQFWEQIYEVAEEGTTVFVTTHYMDEAEY